MSYGDAKGDLAEVQRKNVFLEAENKQLKEEVEQFKTQLSQYRLVNDTQQVALKDKDSLLEQLKGVNESLQNDIKVLKAVKPAAMIGFPKVDTNPWTDPSDGIEPEQFRKLFVGGLDYNTTDSGMEKYFNQFGEVERAAVIKDHKQDSRGFGFVIYKAAMMVDAAQAARPHSVEGRRVDTKRALPKEETDKAENNAQVKKLFVGGFRNETEEADLNAYFSAFGKVVRVEVLHYKDTGKKRGFAFIHFDDFDVVDKLVLIKHHVICGNRCSVKKAVPIDSYKKPRSNSNWNDNQNKGGNFGGNQGNFGGNQGGGNQGGGSQSNFGGNQGGGNQGGGNQGGGNQGNFGGNQGGFGGNQGGFGGNQGGGFGGNQGGGFGGNQGGGFGGNQGGGFGGNQGNYGGNQGGGFGGNQGGGFGGNQGGGFGGNQGGGFGGNQGNVGGNQGGPQGGNQGNFDGNQGGYTSGGVAPTSDGNQGNTPSGGGSGGDVPPQMAAMWSAFYNQYMSTVGTGSDSASRSSGGGPVRASNHQQRAGGPYTTGNTTSGSTYNHTTEDYSQNREGPSFNAENK